MEVLHYPKADRGEMFQGVPTTPAAQKGRTRSMMWKTLLGIGATAVVVIVPKLQQYFEHGEVREKAEQTVLRLQNDSSSSMMDLTQAIEPVADSYRNSRGQVADSLLLWQVMVHELMREIGRDIHARLGAEIPLSEDPLELLPYWEAIIGGEARMSPTQKTLKEKLIKAAAAVKNLQEGRGLQQPISSDASNFVGKVWLAERNLANHLPPLPPSPGEPSRETSLAQRDAP